MNRLTAPLASALFGLALLMSGSHEARAMDSAPVPDSLTTKYGETRAYFRHWLAVCTPGEDPCRAVAYAGDVGHVGDYQFYAHSGMPGLDYMLMFVPVKVTLDTNAPMEIAVDGESMGTFEWGADDGYYRDANVINEFTLGQSRANTDLLPAMMAGSSMDVTFTDENGERRTVTFSLYGLTNALRWMDAFRTSE